MPSWEGKGAVVCGSSKGRGRNEGKGVIIRWLRGKEMPPGGGREHVSHARRRVFAENFCRGRLHCA